MPELELGESNYILRNPASGELRSVPGAEADEIAAKEGLEYATPEQIEKFNLGERRGGAGQVALGLAETAVRQATLGTVPSLSGDTEAARERAQYTGRELPTSTAIAGIAPRIAISAALPAGGIVGRGAQPSAAAFGVLG